MHMYTGKEGGSRRSGATAGSRRMKHEDSSLHEPPDEDVIIVVVDLVNNVPVYIVANATKSDLDNRCTRDGILSESGDQVLARHHLCPCIPSPVRS
jgi:hypothetical protein